MLRIGVSESELDALREACREHAFRVTPYYAALAEISDAVRCQCVPHPAETEDRSEDVSEDPFGESDQSPVPGVIRRYRDRVLILATNRCAVRCRYCTRRHGLGAVEAMLSDDDLARAVQYVRQDAAVREVILSGGDPLVLETTYLDQLLNAFREIPHVEVLRIHSRVPVVMPSRIDAELVAVLADHRPLWLNTQFNHPVELTAEALAACDRLVNSGIPVSNQCVLLKGVNDSVETLVTLCNGLQRNSVRPYYVFRCDPVRGTSHFRTTLEETTALARAVRQRLGGLAMPRFVMDTAGAVGKVSVE